MIISVVILDNLTCQANCSIPLPYVSIAPSFAYKPILSPKKPKLCKSIKFRLRVLINNVIKYIIRNT